MLFCSFFGTRWALLCETASCQPSCVEPNLTILLQFVFINIPFPNWTIQKVSVFLLAQHFSHCSWLWHYRILVSSSAMEMLPMGNTSTRDYSRRLIRGHCTPMWLKYLESLLFSTLSEIQWPCSWSTHIVTLKSGSSILQIENTLSLNLS